MSIFSWAGVPKSLSQKLIRKIHHSFTSLVCMVIALQPMMIELAYAQEIIIDPNGNVGFAPSLQRSSRPQVVDIAKPNSGGVSHNQFSKFDTSPQGVVLNNSQGTVNSKLAGTIAGNGNLTGGTASTIVNEVTSTNTSILSGSIEVAGDRAGVVIANPNGITCNGCNFINASNGTLTTGVPVINGSNVQLDVTQGAITIGRGGLNAGGNGVSNVNLIGRTVIIDGKITAIDGVNVQGGSQRYDLSNQRRTAVLAASGATPDLVVDGSEFGAMEAGRIQIIGNERGLGVRNLGAIQSTVGDVKIASEGDTIVRSAAAQGQANISSSNYDVTIERDVTSATSNVLVYARGSVNTTDRTGIYGFNGVEITARKGHLSFGGDLQSGADVTLHGDRTLTFSGYGSSIGEFILKTRVGRGEITVEDATIVANSLDAEYAGKTFRFGNAAIFSSEDVRINTGEFILGKDVVVDGLTEDDISDLVVNASGDFRNSADLRRHSTATINYAGNLYNEVGGIIEKTDLSIGSNQAIFNAGVIYGSNSLKIDVAQLFNNETGAILSNTLEIVTSGVFENKGTITSEGVLTVLSDTSIVNDGYVQAPRANLTGTEITNTGNGELRFGENAQIVASSSFSNDGILNSLGNIEVNTTEFENNGIVSVDTSFEVFADTIINRKNLTTGGLVTLEAEDSVQNFGLLASFGNASLISGSIVKNHGSLLVDGIADIRGSWFENTGDNALLRAKTGQIYSTNISNSGEIYLVDSFSHRKLNFFENAGVFASQGAIDLRGGSGVAAALLLNGSILVSGLQTGDAQDLLAGQNTGISFQSVRADGRVATGGSLSISGTSVLSVNGQLQTGQNLSLAAAEINVGEDAQLNAGLNAYITATNGFTNDGVISVAETLQLGRNSGSFTNRNVISATTTSRFTLYQGSFENSGIFQTSGTTGIVAANVTNTGHMEAGGNLSLNAQNYVREDYLNSRGKAKTRWIATDRGIISGTGTFSAGAAAYLTGGTVTLADDSYVTSAQLGVTADEFNNDGSVALSGDARNDWQIFGTLHQRGQTYSDGDIRLYAGGLSTYSDSLLGSGKNLSLAVTEEATLGGSISANYIVLSAGSITGAKTSSIVASNDVRITSTTNLDHLGELASGDDLVLTSDTFDLAGNAFGERVSITAISRGDTRGNILARETLDIDLEGGLHNYGLLEARDKVSTNSDWFRNFAAAKVSSTEIDIRSASNLVNVGEISAASRMTLNNGGTFTNDSGSKITAVSLGLEANGFTNRGEVHVYGLFGDVNGHVSNYGTISTKTYFGLEAHSVSNRANAELQSDGHLYLKTNNGALTNYVGAKIKGEVVDLRVGSLSNSGTIQAREVVNVANVAGDIRNNSTGQIFGRTIALVSNSVLRNDGQIGRWWEAETVNLHGENSILNNDIIWGNNIRVTSRGHIQNGGAADITANEFFGVQSEGSGITNYGRFRGDAVLVNANTDFVNEGLVAANQEAFVDVGGKIINRDGASTAAEIKGPIVSLAARNDINNTAVLSSGAQLGLISENGRIYNDGQISGPDITLIARNDAVYSPAAINGSGTLAIEAETIGLRERVRVTDSVLLKSTSGDIEVDVAIQTKDLFVDAARNVKAAAQVFRGSNRTQIIADDIQRSDTNENNTKLVSIADARGDIYVQLRTGSIGIWGNPNGSGHVYETINWDVARSASLLTDQGSILLSGRIQAGDDLFVQARAGSTGVKNIRFDVGDVLHLEGKYYLKRNGSLSTASARRVQLIQTTGWFYTNDWLTNTNINYDLTVQAKNVIVNSSNRFVNGEVFFRASNDIRQTAQVISARKITYSAGNDINIKFYPFGWRNNNPGIQKTIDWWDVESAGIRGHTLLAQSGGITLFSGRDTKLTSGKLHTSKDLTITAARDFLSEPDYRYNDRSSVPSNVGWDFSNKYRDQGNWKPSRADFADHKVAFEAGDRSQTNSNYDIINRNYAPWHDPYLNSYRDDSAGTLDRVKELRAYTNQISAAGDISIQAGNALNLVGTQISSTNGSIDLFAVHAINIASAVGYRKFQSTSRWTDEQVGPDEHHVKAVRHIDDILTQTFLKAEAGGVSLTTEGTLASAGAKINARNVSVKTNQGDVFLGTYKERWFREVKFNRSGGWLGSSDEVFNATFETETQTGNTLAADETVTVSSGRDLTIISGKISAQNVLISAAGNLNILAGINSAKAAVYSDKSNGLTITKIQEGFSSESATLPEILSVQEPVFSIDGETHIAGWRGQNLNSSLLRTIEQREFDRALLNLYTPEEKEDVEDAKKEIDQKYLRDFVLPGASDGQQFAYLDTLIQDHSATYSTIQLRDHQWYDKQVRLSPAFQALLQAIATYITAGSGAGLGINNVFIQAGVDAAVADAVAGLAGGAITGDIDLDEILRGALLAGVSTSISGALTDKINLGSGFSDTKPFVNDVRGTFTASAIVDRAGDAVINKVVTNVVYGEDPFEGFDNLGQTFLVTETLAVAQFGIGELGHGNANWEGSVGHLLLHGGVGCVALEALNGDCAAGFFAGASSSVLAGSNLSDEQKLKLAPLIGAIAAFPFANGEAVNVGFGGTVASSAIENNYLTHRDLKEMLAEYDDCRASDGGCSASELALIKAKYVAVSDARDRILAACTTNGCISDLINPEDPLDRPISNIDVLEIYGDRIEQFDDVSQLLEYQGFEVHNGRVITQAEANVAAANTIASHCPEGDLNCIEAARRATVGTALTALAGGGAVTGLVKFGPIAIQCLANPICRLRLTAAVGDELAQTGGTLAVTTSGAVKIGNRVIGNIDGGSFTRSSATNRIPDGVSFGRNANQDYHVWRHVTDELGMNRQNVQSAIVNDLPPAANLTDGLNIRHVTVDGVQLQYNAFKLPDGTVNIGRIHEAN